MKKVITYGTYDFLHHGHIRLLERAKELGDYLIVGITSDLYDKERGKLNVRQSLVERIENLKKTGLADEIIVEEYEGQKISDIIKHNVDVFAIGSDWNGKFDYLQEYCDVVYLERTKGVSSTEIRESQYKCLKMGIIGTENPALRVMKEVHYVSGLEVTSIWSKDVNNIDTEYECDFFDNLDDMLTNVDVVYISSTIACRFEYIMKSFEHGCHVLCESPAFLTIRQAEKVYEVSKEKRLVFLEAIKTAFFPAFEHLMLLIRSGKIGAIKNIDVSFSQISPNMEDIEQNRYNGALYDMGAYVMYPIFVLVGTDVKDCDMFTMNTDSGFNMFTKAVLRYDNCITTFNVGKGIKTEGNMVIVGTKGYVYVPSPWWLTDYFEVRYEDIRMNKRYFYSYEGDGFRYQLNALISMIHADKIESPEHSWDNIFAASKIIEQFQNGDIKNI